MTPRNSFFNPDGSPMRRAMLGVATLFIVAGVAAQWLFDAVGMGIFLPAVIVALVLLSGLVFVVPRQRWQQRWPARSQVRTARAVLGLALLLLAGVVLAAGLESLF